MAYKLLNIPENFREEDELRELENSDDIEKLRSLLRPDETVCRLIKCMNDGSDGVLAATNMRIIFCDQQFLTSEVVEFLYSEVAALLSESELIMTKVALVGIDKALYVDGIDKAQADRFIAFVEDNIGQDYEASGGSGRHLRHRGEMLNDDDLTIV